MDVVSLLEGLTLWHWVGLAIVLLAFEVMLGTFDLLWIAVAAFATALFALVAPGDLGGWQGQLVFFAVVAAACVVMGRTVFRGLRRAPSTHPNLNARTAAMVGQHGEAVTNFADGEGRVKVGDTVWLALAEQDPAIALGDRIVIDGAVGAKLKVRRS